MQILAAPGHQDNPAVGYHIHFYWLMFCRVALHLFRLFCVFPVRMTKENLYSTACDTSHHLPGFKSLCFNLCLEL